VVDPDRYLFKRGIEYVDEQSMTATGGFTAPGNSIFSNVETYDY